MTVDSAKTGLKIQASALQGFYPLVNYLGGSADGLLRQAGLSEADLSQPSRRLATEKMNQLLTLSATAFQRPEFGLMLGASQDFFALGDLGKLLQYCQTFEDALRIGNGMMAYHNQGEVWHYKVYGEFCYVYRQDLLRHLADARQFTELAFAVCLRLARLAVGGSLDDFRVEFNHQPMSKMLEYQKYLKVPVKFNCPHDALIFPARYMNMPFSDASQSDFFTAMAQVSAGLVTRQRELSEEVSALIQQNLSVQAPSLAFIAKLMGMELRTLQRRLAEQGLVYKQVLLQVRMTLAQRYLNCSEIDVTLVAQLVGYTELSNFTRAFRAYTGISPLKWRKKNEQKEILSEAPFV